MHTIGSRTLSLGVFYCLLALVVASPAPFGAAREWAWLPLCFAITSLSAAWFALLAVRGTLPITFPPLKPLFMPLGLFILVLCWGYIQTVEWTPAAWQHPLWQDTAAAIDKRPLHSSIALNVHKTFAQLLRFVSYALVFLLTAMLAHNKERSHKVLWTLSLAGLVYACYGLLIFFSGNTAILWTEKWAYLDDLTSTFINRNSYATFAGVITLCFTSLLIRRCKKTASMARGRRRTIISMLLKDMVTPRVLFLITSLFLVMSSLLLSNSRAGLFSTLIALSVLIVFSLKNTLLPRWAKALFGAVCAALLFAVMMGTTSNTLSRLLATNLEEEGRPAVYAVITDAIADAPLLGFGLGNFADAFPLYRDYTVKGYYDRAHNDYLELVFELGMPAAALFYVSILWIVALCWRGVRHGNHKTLPLLAVSTSVLVGVHAVVDFSLQMPAISCFYSMILGAGYAQSVKTQTV